MGRLFIIAGLVVLALGVAMVLGVKPGRLPGDIVIERKGGSFYFPVVTCLLVSVVLTLANWLFGRR